jgi:hypothetical protein
VLLRRVKPTPIHVRQYPFWFAEGLVINFESGSVQAAERRSELRSCAIQCRQRCECSRPPGCCHVSVLQLERRNEDSVYGEGLHRNIYTKMFNPAYYGASFASLSLAAFELAERCPAFRGDARARCVSGRQGGLEFGLSSVRERSCIVMISSSVGSRS